MLEHSIDKVLIGVYLRTTKMWLLISITKEWKKVKRTRAKQFQSIGKNWKLSSSSTWWEKSTWQIEKSCGGFANRFPKVIDCETNTGKGGRWECLHRQCWSVAVLHLHVTQYWSFTHPTHKVKNTETSSEDSRVGGLRPPRVQMWFRSFSSKADTKSQI